MHGSSFAFFFVVVVCAGTVNFLCGLHFRNIKHVTGKFRLQSSSLAAFEFKIFTSFVCPNGSCVHHFRLLHKRTNANFV